MASLAANIPQSGDPEYLRYSHPISAIEPNRSGQYLGKGLGEAIDIGAKTGVEAVDSYVENKAYEQRKDAAESEQRAIDPVWNKFFGDENTQTAGQPLAFAENQNQDTTGAPIPSAVQQGIKTAGALNERWINGKISQTDYKSEIAKIAKQLNSDYPAFRGAISRGFERATGEGSADAMIKSKIQDLDRLMQGLKEQSNKADTYFYRGLEHAPPEAQAEAIRRRNLPADDPQHMGDQEAVATGIKFLSTKNNIDLERAGIELSNAKRTKNERDVSDGFDKVLGGIMDRNLHAVVVANGASTTQELLEKLQQYREHPDDPAALKVAVQFANAIQRINTEMVAQSRQLYGKGLDPEKAQQKIQAVMADLKSNQADLTDPTKALNAVTMQLQQYQALERNIQAHVANTESGRLGIYNQTLSKLFPQFQNEIFDATIKNTRDLGKMFGSDLNDFLKSGLSIRRNDPTTPAPDALEQFNSMKKAGANAASLTRLVDMSDKIVSANRGGDTEAAYRLAMAYFNPKNQGLIAKYTANAYDSQTNEVKPGRVDMFRKLGSDEMTKTIYELGKTYPDLKAYYTQFMENSFGMEVFPGLMQSFKSVSNAAGSHVAYDTETGHFHIRDANGTILTPDLTRSQPYGDKSRWDSHYTVQTLGKLNYAIDGMKAIAKAEGKDPNEYLLGLINRYAPGSLGLQTRGLPDAIMNSLNNQILIKEKEKQDEAARMKKAAEQSKTPFSERFEASGSTR